MQRVQRLTCTAHLDESRDELERARASAAAGDSSWAQWVREFDEGSALILRLDVEAFFDGPAGPGAVGTTNRAVWVERQLHPPLVAGQIEEAVSKDFNQLAAALRDSGVAWVTADDLALMHVQVELAPELLARLRRDRLDSYPVG